MTIKLTHKGGYRVFRERTLIVECKTEREATQHAINVKLSSPGKDVSIEVDYRVDVELEPEE